MTQIQRMVTWGDEIFVRAGRASGGLKRAVERIQLVVGAQIGTRNSFVPLFDVTDPAKLNEKFAWRAWLLLVTLDQEPASWGIYDDAVPAIFADRVDDLKRMLCTPRDLNPEPTDYRSARGTRGSSRPRNRAGRTSPKGRAA